MGAMIKSDDMSMPKSFVPRHTSVAYITARALIISIHANALTYIAICQRYERFLYGCA